MKFSLLFRLLDLLKQGKEIGISFESDDNCDVNIIDRFTKDDYLENYMKYLTSSKYHFYIIDYDGFASSEEIKGD